MSGFYTKNEGTGPGSSVHAGVDDQSSGNDDQITITDTEVVINDDSDDLDFRVESDANTHMLFVDAGNGKVGINTATPDAMFEIEVGTNDNVDAFAITEAGYDRFAIEADFNSANNPVTIKSNTAPKMMKFNITNGNVGFSDEFGDDKITIDGAVSLKEQSSAPSATADYAKIVAMEDGADTYTKVLLHGDGSAGGTTFTNDGSGSNWTAGSGDPTTETAQKEFGSASLYFDGNDSIEMDSGDLGDVAMGTGDFTIEFWMRLDAEPSGAIGIMSGLGTAAGGRSAIENGMYLQYYHASDERCAFRWRSKTDGSRRIDVSWNPHWRALTWYHIAVVRDGNEIIIYQNGRPQVTRDYGTDTQVGADELEEIDSQFRIGEGQNSDWFTGYIDEVRISKGVARYKTPFVPQGQAFPLARAYAFDESGTKTLIG